MAARPGFEPRQTEPESVVLPLHHRADREVLQKMAPAAGFEPATKWLTATYSTAELCRSVYHKIL